MSFSVLMHIAIGPESEPNPVVLFSDLKCSMSIASVSDFLILIIIAQLYDGMSVLMACS